MRAVSAWAALTGLVLLVAAVAEAINPKWLRQPRRARAFGIYFGLAVVSLFIAVAVSPARVSDSKSENKPMVASESRPAKVIVAPTEESPSVREYQALASLLTAFESLTDLQQEEWNLRHQWAHWVQGEGAVSEVTRTSPFSEIKGAAYEVTVELPGGDRGVLFYPVDQKELVLRLSVGSVMTFQGRLKKIQDWGFWRSGYVRVE